MKPRRENRTDERNELVLSVLQKSEVPLGPSQVAKLLELQNMHWWGFSPNCRILVYAILKRINAVRHPGGKFTEPPPYFERKNA